MTEEQILFAAFFHDFGKLLERSRAFNLAPDLAEVNTYAHAKFSAQFIRAVRESGAFEGYDLRGSYLATVCNEEVEQVVLFHHAPRSLEGLIIQLADWIQSAERKEKEEVPQERYLEENLVSPFLWTDTEAQKLYFSLEPLSFKNIVPQPREKVKRGKEAYRALYREFLPRLSRVKDFEQLLALAEIYLSAVPAQTGIYEGDISLFDHARLVAGLSQILYQDVQRGILSEAEVKNLPALLKEKEATHPLMEKPLFSLCKLDLSGIQKFLFTVPSKRALRMIKGRSVYLDFLLRYVVKYCLRELSLSSACVLYLGGGNAEILLPYGVEEVLEQVRNRVCGVLFDFHQGELYVAMEWLPVSLRELFRFIETREKLQERIEARKKQRFFELGEETFFDRFFLPEENVIGEGEGCGNCGQKKAQGELCTGCASFVEFTDALKGARYLQEETMPPLLRPPRTVWEVFESLGFRITFLPEPFSGARLYLLEEISVDIEGGRLADGFLLGSFRLPDTTFEELAKTSLRDDLGDPSLGYLKMDVDNLGAVFRELSEQGKERATALSLYRAFSRYLELFFGGYLVHLLQGKLEKKQIYPVFVGGDDLFLIGGWREIVRLADDIRREFARYTGSSRRLTLSAGISLLPPKFPVVRAAKTVEETLEMAKNFFYPEDIKERWMVKDKVGIFEEVLTWREYQEALDVYLSLEESVRSGDRVVPRAVFRKIEQSFGGFETVLHDSLQGALRFPRIWRFLYLLRDHRDIAERIEGILLRNIIGKEKIRNPRLVLVANRLAAMATRKYEKRGEEDAGE
jgi:CRISPR-associated protein Csm1